MPWELSNLHIHRGPGPPIRCQLAARLAGLVRDGYLTPGTRLPSVRRLASHLGIHRNTAWACYRRLEAARLVVAVQGSGVFVGELHPTGRKPAHPSIQLVLVEPFEELRAVLACELRTRLGLPVRTVHPRVLEYASPPRKWEEEALFLARRAVLARLCSRRLTPAHVHQLEPAGGCRELAMVTRLPPRSVVAVVTEAASIRRFARTLAVTAQREGIGIASPRPADQAAVRRAARISDLVFADASSRRLIDHRHGRRLVELRVLADRSILQLRAVLKHRAE